MPIITKPKNPREPQTFWERLTRRRGWGYPDILDVQGSVFFNLVPILVSATLWTILIAVLYTVFNINVSFSSNLTGSIALVVGLLLAFRTNNAYDRYNEGRKLFSSMCTYVRNCTRTIWIGVVEKNVEDRQKKVEHIKLLLAFVVAVKHHLRLEFGTHWGDLNDLLLPEDFQFTEFEGTADQTAVIEESEGKTTIEMPHTHVTRTLSSRIPPTLYVKEIRPSLIKMSEVERKNLYGDCESDFVEDEIIFHLGRYIEKQCKDDKFDLSKFGSVVGNLNSLIDCLGNLERIANTPIPTAYNVHLKQAVMLYVFALPFTIIAELGWFTVPTIFLVSFTFFGILAVGTEIENPFGYDENDLPLDDYCKDMEAEVKYLERHLPTTKV
ncbi:6505_t:CDS:10, partial [Scutellospora calospora]